MNNLFHDLFLLAFVVGIGVVIVVLIALGIESILPGARSKIPREPEPDYSPSGNVEGLGIINKALLIHCVEQELSRFMAVPEQDALHKMRLRHLYDRLLDCSEVHIYSFFDNDKKRDAA